MRWPKVISESNNKATSEGSVFLPLSLFLCKVVCDLAVIVHCLFCIPQPKFAICNNVGCQGRSSLNGIPNQEMSRCDRCTLSDITRQWSCKTITTGFSLNENSLLDLVLEPACFRWGFMHLKLFKHLQSSEIHFHYRIKLYL
jgi:hypothetical protein